MAWSALSRTCFRRPDPKASCSRMKCWPASNTLSHSHKQRRSQTSWPRWDDINRLQKQYHLQAHAAFGRRWHQSHKRPYRSSNVHFWRCPKPNYITKQAHLDIHFGGHNSSQNGTSTRRGRNLWATPTVLDTTPTCLSSSHNKWLQPLQSQICLPYRTSHGPTSCW